MGDRTDRGLPGTAEKAARASRALRKPASVDSGETGAVRRKTPAVGSEQSGPPTARRRSASRSTRAENLEPAHEPGVGMVKVKLVRSPIGSQQRHKDTVRSLGLRRMHQVIEQPDSPQLRGMIFAVKHLVQVIE
jgi:large subunit ribosomal protein L30